MTSCAGSTSSSGRIQSESPHLEFFHSESGCAEIEQHSLSMEIERLSSQIEKLQAKIFKKNDFVIAVSQSNKEFGVRLCKKFGLPTNLLIEQKFANGEVNIKLDESVRGKTVYLVCTGAFNNDNSSFTLNDNLMSIFLTVSALKISSAKSINLIMPCFPYARADKKDHRGPISSAIVSLILKTIGVNRVIVTDLHAGQTQGTFYGPFDNIYCKNTLIDYLNKNVFAGTENLNDHFILCSPDAGGVKRTIAYSEKLKLNWVSMGKRRDYGKMNSVSKSILMGETEQLVGKTVIIVDDMADTMGTMCSATVILESLGASGCIIVVTHGYFSGEAIDRINKTDFIEQVICTNSIPQTTNMTKCSKIKCVDLSDLIGEVITRIEGGGSVSALFE